MDAAVPVAKSGGALALLGRALLVRLVALALLAWWLQAPAGRMAAQTVSLLASRLEAAPGTWSAHLATPGAGQHVLPSQVVAVLALLREQQVTTYRLAEPLASEPLFNQRLVEAAWPARPAADAALLVVRDKELPAYAGWPVVAERGGYALVRRP